jgi:hypothetical protein
MKTLKRVLSDSVVDVEAAMPLAGDAERQFDNDLEGKGSYSHSSPAVSSSNASCKTRSRIS